MRKEYGTVLRELFTDGLAYACPEFNLVKAHSAAACFPGERAYCWRISESVFLWVVLIPDQKREAFFVELGWSRRGRFPQLTALPSGIRPSDPGLVNEKKYLCRLGELSRGDDVGWLVEELRLDATEEEIMAYVVAQTKPLSAEAAGPAPTVSLFPVRPSIGRCRPNRSEVLPCTSRSSQDLPGPAISLQASSSA